jgi:hypothetical protein
MVIILSDMININHHHHLDIMNIDVIDFFIFLNFDYYYFIDKKHHKRPSISPIHTPDQDLYSDKEKANQKSSDDCSRSQSKQEGTPNHQSPGIENNEESQRDTNDNEDQQHDSKEIPKRKSRPRKKKHDRREHYNPQFYGELPPHNRVNLIAKQNLKTFFSFIGSSATTL